MENFFLHGQPGKIYLTVRSREMGKKQIIRYEVKEMMELIKEYKETKWQNASWVALNAVSPNFINRACRGCQKWH